MPFKEHPDINSPDNPGTRIWRYMDLTKFLSMLEDQALFFSRLDILAQNDPYEGLYTNLNARIQELNYSDLPKEFSEKKGIVDEATYLMAQEAQKQSRSFIRQQREITFVSSWCLNDHESAAMWPLYVQGNEAIAVQSTFGRLVESMKDYDAFEIYIG